jgi:hypothetical protein
MGWLEIITGATMHLTQNSHRLKLSSSKWKQGVAKNNSNPLKVGGLFAALMRGREMGC